MHFRKALFLGLSALVAHAAAQDRLGFTSIPSSVTAGETVEITYAGGDPNQETTILLKQGNPTDLDTVAVLTSTATGGSFSWTPDETLPSGTDYAFEIQQGSEVNYSGQFSLESDVPATAASVSSALSSVSASASSATASVSASVSSATASVSSALSSQLSSVVSSVLASLNGSSSTTLSTTTLTGAATLPTGTGTGIARNSTLVSPTLSATSTSTQTTTTGTGTTGTGASSTTGANNANAAAGLSSPLALVLGAVVAMIYLN